MKYIKKNQKLRALHIVESRSKQIKVGFIVTCVDIIAQVSLPRSIFLLLQVLTMKLWIIILPTNRPEIILPTARTTKNQVAFTLYLYENDRK